MAGKSWELAQPTVREAEAGGVEVAKEVEAQARDMDEDALEDMEEDVVKEDPQWLMASTSLMSPDHSCIRNVPLSLQ